jgi:hypothetical protein
MSLEPKYTIEELREMSKQLQNITPMHQFGMNRASSMLDWAANVIEAARAALTPKIKEVVK